MINSKLVPMALLIGTTTLISWSALAVDSRSGSSNDTYSQGHSAKDKSRRKTQEPGTTHSALPGESGTMGSSDPSETSAGSSQ